LILGGIVQNPTESGYTAGKDWCENLLKTVRPEWYTTDDGRNSCNWSWGDSEKWHLQRCFEDYLSRINDLRIILEADDVETEPQYLSLPYRTRFNSEERINRQFSILNSCLEKAADWYDAAAFTTLTTWPGHFDNLWEAITEINRNFNRFMSCLQNDSHLGYRPDYVKVLEFQESGNPHLHVVFFLEDDSRAANGRPHLCEKSWLDDYWAKWQGGYVNDLQPLEYVDDLPDEYTPDAGWVRWQSDGDHGGLLDKSREATADDTGNQTVGQYLGKYLSATYGGIRGLSSNDHMGDDATSEKFEDKQEPWKLALYWASRRKIKTVSRDLRQAVEDEFNDDVESELKEVLRERRYEVVGSFYPTNIPSHIRSKLRELRDLVDNDDDPWKNPPGYATSQEPPPAEALEDELVRRILED
jgi:hypothetical protein